MSNYKWFNSGKPDEPINPLYTHLRSNDLTAFAFPCIAPSKMDYLVQEELLKVGIETELTCDFDSYCYVLRPVKLNYTTITAPLYCYDEATSSYVQIARSFTGGTIDPAQYDWVKEELANTVKKVWEQQTQKFFELFRQNSLDGGLTALIPVTPHTYNIPVDCFMSKYLPTGNFFEICRLTNRFDPDSPAMCIFMKKMNVKGGSVTIKVPKRLKALTIGRSGQNIKQVAIQINARRINVI